MDVFTRLGVPMGTALGTALTYTGRIDEGIAYNERNVEPVIKGGNPLVMALIGHELTLTLALARAVGRARAWGERILAALTEVTGEGHYFEGWLRRPLVLACALAGDTEKAAESCRVAEDIESRTLLGCFYEDAAAVGFHYLRQGDWDRSSAYLERALAAHQARHTLIAASGCSLVLGSLELERGNHARAEELLLRSLAICREGGNVLFELWVLPALAKVCLRTAQPDRAAEYVQRGFELLAPDQNWHGLPAPLFTVRGMLARARRDWDEAVASFERAVAISREHRLPRDEARALAEWGLAHLGRHAIGDRSHAREKLGAAATIFRQIGAERDVEKVLAAMPIG